MTSLKRQLAWLLWCKDRRQLSDFEAAELERIEALTELAEPNPATDVLKVGDMVSWQERTPTRTYLHTLTGIIIEAVSTQDEEFAWIQGATRIHAKRLTSLTKVGPIEAVVDDWEFAMRQCGDLGGAEL